MVFSELVPGILPWRRTLPVVFRFDTRDSFALVSNVMPPTADALGDSDEAVATAGDPSLKWGWVHGRSPRDQSGGVQ